MRLLGAHTQICMKPEGGGGSGSGGDGSDELYALCRRRNGPCDFADAYAKVAIIGRPSSPP